LVRRDGYAVPLTSTCDSELRVPAPSKPVLVALETSAGAVVRVSHQLRPKGLRARSASAAVTRGHSRT
jgi:hypothetical protein